MDDQMAAILANLESGLAAAEGDSSPLAASILNLSSTDATAQEKGIRDVINATLREEDRIYVLRHDGVAPVVKLLKEGSSTTLRTLGAHGLANLSLSRDARVAIAREGGLSALVSALASDQDALKERALAALCNLCVAEDDLRLTVVKEGGIARTLHILTTGRDATLISAALMLIANIAVNVQIAGQIAHDGGVSIVGKYIGSSDASQKRLAIFSLSALSCNPASHSQLSSYIRDFSQALQSADAEVEGKLFVALVNLSGNSSAANDFVSSGVLPAISRRLDSTDTRLQAFALQAIQNLAIAENTRAALGSSGAPAKVLQVLRGNAVELVPHALRATTNLCCDGNIRRDMVQQGGIPVVERWQSSSDPAVRDAASQALVNLKA